MTAKCPSCQKTIASLDGDGTNVSFNFGGESWKTIVFKCPLCNAVLGAQVDPIALRTDIVNMVTDRIAKLLNR
jgi:hypothetical protein